MRKALPILLAIVFSLVLAETARAQVQIFGGYSYVRPAVTVQTTNDCPGVGCPITATTTTHVNMNGWEFAGTYNLLKILGLTGDFDGTYGKLGGASVHLQTYLFGPQIHLPGPISPFAHAFVGGAHESLTSGPSVEMQVTGFSDDSFAAAVGGGIDIATVPFLSLRVIQIDDVITRFGSATQHQPRASAGIVIHF